MDRDTASRHLPEEMKARHPGIPWRKVAGIGNISPRIHVVSADVLWRLVRDDRAALEQACRAELTAQQPEI